MGAAAAESFRLAAPVPAGLKAHTLALASGQEPAAIAHRAAVLSRTGSFAKHGFPKPAHHAGAKAGLLHHAGAKAGLGSSSHGPTAVAAGAVLAVAIAVVAVVLSGGTEHVKLAGGKPPGALPPSAAAAAALPPATGKSTPTPHPPPTTPPALAPILAPTAAVPTPAATTAPTAAAAAAPTPTAITVSPTPTPAPPTPTPTPTPSPTPTPPPTANTLVVTPSGGPLVIPPGGLSITLTAQGGPVDWSITVSGDRQHHVRVDPSSGTLADGASVRVTIKVDHTAVGETVTISPGDTTFAIVIGWPVGKPS
jgi:hypothetical protein